MYKWFYYCLSQKIEKYVIFGGKISFLGGKFFFQILLNEAKTHPNHMDLNEYYNMTKKCAVLPLYKKVDYYDNNYPKANLGKNLMKACPT